MKRLRSIVVCVGLAGLLAASAAARSPVRIDGTSTASVTSSMKKMLASLPPERQLQLQIAVVQLNLVGVDSAKQMVDNPDLQNLSADRIRDRIDGKTADEIIALAARTATTTVHIGEPPGLPPAATRPLAAGIPPKPLAGTRWEITDFINGHTKSTIFHLEADGSAGDESHPESGPTTWEQSGDEVRLMVNKRYSYFFGKFTDADTLSGEAGNVKRCCVDLDGQTDAVIRWSRRGIGRVVILRRSCRKLNLVARKCAEAA